MSVEFIYQWDREDKLYAIEALHHSTDPERGEYLLQLIVDEDPVVRGKTAIAMEDLPDEQLLEAVQGLLEQDETEYQILACELLGATEETDFSDTLEPLLHAEDDRVVKAAIAVLDQLPDEKTLELLNPLVERYRTEWSKAVKRLLNRWHPTESFPVIQSLYTDVDAGFRPDLLRLAALTDHTEAPDWIDEQLEELDVTDQKESVVRWLV